MDIIRESVAKNIQVNKAAMTEALNKMPLDRDLVDGEDTEL